MTPRDPRIDAFLDQFVEAIAEAVLREIGVVRTTPADETAPSPGADQSMPRNANGRRAKRVRGDNEHERLKQD